MSQTSMSDEPTRAYPGLMFDSAYTDNISRIVSTQQTELVTIAGNDDGTFTIVIDSVTEATYTAASNTDVEIAADLLADLQNSANSISATAPSNTTIAITMTDVTKTADSVFVVNSDNTSSDITIAQQVAQSQEIPYGVLVVVDPLAASTGVQCRLPRATGEITGGTDLGISIGDSSYPNDSGTGYADNKSVPIMRKGRIWVRTEDICAEGGAVFVRFTDPQTGYGLGSFRSDADGSDAVALPGARYWLTSAAAGLNIVELNPHR